MRKRRPRRLRDIKNRECLTENLLSESIQHVCGHQAGFSVCKINVSVFRVYFAYVIFPPCKLSGSFI